MAMSVAVDSLGADDVSTGVDGPKLAVVGTGVFQVRAVHFERLQLGDDFLTEAGPAWRFRCR